MQEKAQVKNMQTFLIIWFGELISLLGTKMTSFALLIWVYQETGQATTMALLGFFSFGTYVLFSPLGGYWADHLDRRRVMLWADLGAGIMTVLVLVLMAQGDLQLWHLYLAQGLTGFFEAFQAPAYAASISMLIPKKHFGRASGLRSFAQALGDIAAPLLAGLALVLIGIEGVMLFDVLTFLFAVLTLLIVRIPAPPVQARDAEEGETFWEQVTFGWRYIRKRSGLQALTIAMALINFFAALTYFGILPAMVLARTGGDEGALAITQSALGIGAILGAILMSIWGGTKRKIHGFLLGIGFSFLIGDLMFAIGRNVPMWIVAGLGASVFIPLIVGSNAAIWQIKVPPQMQGRVLQVERAIRMTMLPLGYILGGLLADFVFEPAMNGGVLEPVFGWLVGTGAGSGMALMFILTWLGGTIVGFGGYYFASLRNVESDLPDFDSIKFSVQRV